MKDTKYMTAKAEQINTAQAIKIVVWSDCENKTLNKLTFLGNEIKKAMNDFGVYPKN